MVTLDNKVENVKSEFKGDLTRGRLDYERATQGLERIEERRTALERTLKQETGFSNFNLPKDPMKTDIGIGEVHFTIKSETRTKRPAYRKLVERMEEYISGVAWAASLGKEVPGGYSTGRNIYMETSTLISLFDIFVGGVMKPEVKQTIRYKASGALKKEETPDEIRLGTDTDLTGRTANEYVRLDRMQKSLAAYAKAYEASLKPDKTTPVTKRNAYTQETSQAQGPRWAYVTMTLITVPTNPDKEGELNILADPNISKAEKERMLPDYRLTYSDREGDKKLYVSLQSVYNRIQDLKGERSVTADRIAVNGKEIV